MKNQLSFISCLILILITLSCKEKKEESIQQDSLFTAINMNVSNIDFKNTIEEDSKFNFINYPYIYNGGGVASGDINNDGLPDLYFTSNQESNSLYLNQGGFKFKNITNNANVSDNSGWSTGVTMVDINNDGYLDIYVCKSGYLESSELRKNKLFINQKNNTFKEDAKAYGLDHSGFSVQAYFFDFDLDNDLDMYLVNHRKDFKNSALLNTRSSVLYKKHESDQLFRNDSGLFVNITKEAGVVNNAWGLSASIGDFNNDNLPDIYVANDFIAPDILYINKGDGTFKNEILSRLKHISYNSMGTDFADINNDLFPDLVVLDMLAEDHIRSKENMATMDTGFFWALVNSGYHHQYMSNTLQLNNGNGTFSDIGQLAGIAKTDWSWSPLIADFDNDGYSDLFVTNGIENDLTNQDFRKEIKKILNNDKGLKLKKAIKMMPSEKLSNYIFKNGKNLVFQDKTKQWGLDTKTNSNGAVYSDLDNDGDLDLVINNQSEIASIYKNNNTNNFINFSFIGPQNNIKGIGVEVIIFTEENKQTKQLYTSRGFQSSVEDKLLFGIGKNIKIDSAIVVWPNCYEQKLLGLKSNTHYLIDYKKANPAQSEIKIKKKHFEEINTKDLGITYTQNEYIFDDYRLQLLLPQKQSEISSPLVVGDVNNDGLDDFFVGNGKDAVASLYIQSKTGFFKESSQEIFSRDKAYEDTNAIFVDVDNDTDLDLYVVSGSYEFESNDTLLQDRLYLNKGNGSFVKSNNIPKILSNSKGISKADYDQDGDLDLLVSGRVKHAKYPLQDSSYLLENNNGVFIDITPEKIKTLSNTGMINDVLFTDFDDDKDYDIIALGEWMEIVFLENNNNIFTPKKFNNLTNLNGWFQSITEADLDNDGFNDYIIGNYGLNNKFHPSKEKPLHLYAGYLDNNITFDVVLSKESKTGDLLPVRGKECSTEQIPGLGEKIKSYKKFANLTLPDIYGEENLNNATHYVTHTFKTFILKNKNGLGFEIIDLPNEAQRGPTLKSLLVDINNDSLLDIISVGSIYEAEVETIRYDASKGYTLIQQKDNSFKYHPELSGFTENESKSIAQITIGGHLHFIILNKNSKLQILKLND